MVSSFCFQVSNPKVHVLISDSKFQISLHSSQSSNLKSYVFCLDLHASRWRFHISKTFASHDSSPGLIIHVSSLTFAYSICNLWDECSKIRDWVLIFPPSLIILVTKFKCHFPFSNPRYGSHRMSSHAFGPDVRVTQNVWTYTWSWCTGHTKRPAIRLYLTNGSHKIPSQVHGYHKRTAPIV